MGGQGVTLGGWAGSDIEWVVTRQHNTGALQA